jgi:hypothetical protein
VTVGPEVQMRGGERSARLAEVAGRQAAHEVRERSGDDDDVGAGGGDRRRTLAGWPSTVIVTSSSSTRTGAGTVAAGDDGRRECGRGRAVADLRGAPGWSGGQ